MFHYKIAEENPKFNELITVMFSRCSESLYPLSLRSGIVVHLPSAVWTHVWSPLHPHQKHHPQQGEDSSSIVTRERKSPFMALVSR